MVIEVDSTSGLQGTDYIYLTPDGPGPACVAPLSISSASKLPNATPNAPYLQTLTASGGTAPYSWSLTAGSLPPGMALSAAGAISGSATASGLFSFTVQVKDAVMKTFSQSLTISVISILTVTTPTQLPAASSGVPYSQPLTATGGNPPYTWAFTGGSLPPGLNLFPSGSLSGTPSGTGNFSFTARVTDSGAASSAQAFSLSVATPAAISQTTSALAHIAAGDTYVTGFSVINNSSQTAQFTINFYGDSGAALPLSFSGQPASPRLSDTLPPNGSAYYETGNAQAPLVAGWGQLVADPSVVVQSLFRNRSGNGIYYEAAVPSSTGSNGFLIPFDATTFAPTGSRLYTGFAIANMDSSRSANITCVARSTNGTVIPNALIIPTLNPLGHYANYLFPALTGNRGTLDCSSNTVVGAIALRFLGDNAFSSLPVILK